MPDQTVRTNHPRSVPKSQSEAEATLHDVIDTLHDSNFFPRTGKDALSRFWFAYDRVAKQHDDELIERHNGEMDVLLIFAGLFSAVSSAFIVNMHSSLIPSASDTTNTLLKILVNKLDNTTFPAQEVALPVWTGPSSTTIWIQTLAYASLSSSLLAAFGVVLAKQWLGHFKTSRFGKGALHERCQRRQRKLDGLEAWHFSTILAALPIFLQMSLFFFGIAIAAKIWTLQHTVASVIMATTVFGFIFYFFTVVSSLKSPDCPFQTPVSNLLQHALRYTTLFLTAIRTKWKGPPKTWADFRGTLREPLRCTLNTVQHLFAKWIALFVKYLPRIPSTMRQVRISRDPEATVGLGETEGAEEQTAQLVSVLASLEPPDQISQIYAVQSAAVQWMLEISTDMDNMAAAAGMIPEIEWSAAEDVSGVLDRLKTHFYECCNPTWQILPLAQARATACLKAMSHVCVERGLDNPFRIETDGDILLNDHCFFQMPPDLAYLAVSCAVAKYPVSLDIGSLPLSDRLWMAQMFAYRLHKGDNNPEFVAFVINFIGTCLDSESPVRLVTDCLLLAGMFVGLPIDRRHLARLDKSKAINKLRRSVMSHTLGVLVGDIPGEKEVALKLVHPLLQDYHQHICFLEDRRTLQRVLKCCVHLAEGTLDEDQARSNCIANLMRVIAGNLPLDPSDLCTSAQVDVLVDYHVWVCEGTDLDLIRETFWVLMRLSGSPCTLDRMRRYIDTMIHFMDEEIVCDASLRAAVGVRSGVAAAGREDESLRERFSKALASYILLDVAPTPLSDNPFNKISLFYGPGDMPYLRLLCTLSQEPPWHPQLHQNGHFDNFLEIANILSAKSDDYRDEYTVPVTHILAIIDGMGEEHPFFHAVQLYLTWPLILRALRYIFRLEFFGGTHGASPWEISTADCLAALLSIVASAKRRYDAAGGALFALVEQACRKLDEEPEEHKQETQRIQGEVSIGNQEILDLCEQIRRLVDTAHRVV